MNQEELEKKIIELEEKLDAVTEHSNELEEQTRDGFAQITKLLHRFMAANNQIAESVVLDLEEKASESSESDYTPQEIIDKFEEIDAKLEDLEQRLE